MPQPLDQLADCLHGFPGENAFCIAGKFYSYRELEISIGKIQSKILEHVAASHVNIGIVTYDDIETYASVLAVLFLGHAFVPVHPLHPRERNRSVILQAELPVLLSSADGETENYFSAFATIVKTGNHLPAAAFVRVPLSSQQHAYILFTSGSTGVPKGVPVTVGNLNAFLEAFFALGYRLDQRDRFIQMFDMTFDLSIMSYMAPLCIGACVYTLPVDSIKYVEVYKLLEQYKITFALLVPSILTSLRRYFSEIQLPDLKYSLFCGEALVEDVTLEWSSCVPGALVQNAYGPTETTIFCMTGNVNRDAKNKSVNGILSIGKPMKNTDAGIFSEGLALLPPNEKGELCLAGGQVTPGYWKNEAQNKKSFFNFKGNRYYRTGDVCFMDEEGDYFFCGRTDAQVKINGYRVEPGEIEHHAREFLKNHSVAAIAAETTEGMTEVFLFVENHAGDFTGLVSYLKTKLPDYMLPTRYLNVSSFPLNANGKLDRKALMKTIL
jgi:D-alanine--poly(phosphoribitol) ligase subunit 1